MDDFLDDTAPCPGPPPVDGIEDFAARCAHDFNNLLTGILGNLELLQSRARRTGVAQFDSYLEGARNAAERAAAFASRLLVFSGRATDRPTSVPVNNLLRELAELMRVQAMPVGVDLDDQAGDVFCDPAQLELALLELLANAREATAAGGAVTLQSRAIGAAVGIAVVDGGSGMAPDILARAEEPFFSTRPGGAGKGLGLPIAAHFARAAGGTLTLGSMLAQGTAATLILPRPPSSG